MRREDGEFMIRRRVSIGQRENFRACSLHFFAEMSDWLDKGFRSRAVKRAGFRETDIHVHDHDQSIHFLFLSRTFIAGLNSNGAAVVRSM